jgi:hypothetical protein
MRSSERVYRAACDPQIRLTGDQGHATLRRAVGSAHYMERAGLCRIRTTSIAPGSPRPQRLDAFALCALQFYSLRSLCRAKARPSGRIAVTRSKEGTSKELPCSSGTRIWGLSHPGPARVGLPSMDRRPNGTRRVIAAIVRQQDGGYLCRLGGAARVLPPEVRGELQGQVGPGPRRGIQALDLQRGPRRLEVGGG